MRILLPFLLALVGFMSRPAQAVSPTEDELAQAQRWVTAHFTDRAAIPPFSFIYGGGSSGPAVKEWRRELASRPLDPRRTEHTLTLTDPKTGLVCRCVVIQYRDVSVVEWILHFRNDGKEDTPTLENVQALDLGVRLPAPGPFVLHRSLGDSNSGDSFRPIDQPLEPNVRLVLAPNGGRSSDGYLPFFNLSQPGEGLVIAVGWSGQWQATFHRVDDRTTNVQAGMQLTHLRLHPGEEIRTPRILLTFWKGDDPLRGNNLFRQVLLAHYSPQRDGQLVMPPICGSVGETDPNGCYEGPHIRVMPILAQRGIEVFWSDMDPQQWYPGGFPEGTGTWEPDPAKYPRGMKPIGEAAHAAGLGYLLWFEPERVHFKSRIDREHPEWVMKQDKEWSQLFRLHDPAARAWLTDTIDVQITAARLDWVRWDFNIEPLGFWRRNDPPDRQGITEIRHVEGLYAMWDDLRRRHSGLVIDNCASGGRRIDLETCMRGLPLWHSDLQCSGPSPAAEQLQNGGLSRWVPLHGCGNFGLEPSYQFRSGMTAGNILCTGTAAPDTADAVKRTVAIYKKVRPYMLGDFYPLFPHGAGEDVWYGYQFHRPDLNAGAAILFRRAKSPYPAAEIRLNGLDPKGTYAVALEGSPDRITRPAAELSPLRVEIPVAPGSMILFYGK